MHGQLSSQPCSIRLINVETLIPGQHPVRVIERMCDEELVGWRKTTGNFRKGRDRGVERTNVQGQYVVITCNLVRMARRALPPPQMARA